MRMQWLSLLVMGALSGVVSFTLTWHYVNQWRDNTLEQVAQSVVRHGLEREGDDETDIPDKGQFTSQIWTQDGTLYYSSAVDDGPPRQGAGWHTLDWQGQDWHVFTLVQDGLTIQVSQPSQTRARAFGRIAPGLAATMLAILAGLYVMLRLSATWSLRPLNELRQALDNGAPLSPHEGLNQRTWPSELEPLVGTLGTLFDRLTDARQAQQHLVARAAHEFRTPLAALKIHAQLLGRSAQPEHDERHRAQLLLAVDRMTRLVDQLLQLAEFDAMPQLAQPEHFEAGPWLAQALPLWHALAEARNVLLQVQVPANTVLQGHPQAMQAMLDNIVHNALRHSLAGASVLLALEEAPDAWVWRVTDHGPGMSAEQKAAASETFSQVPQVHSQGSGLGLTIARRVAHLHGGSLSLEDTPDGGLTVCMTLPRG
jgi:signal transduction histidine kinase